MDEIISGVQVIKMYAWESPFAKLIMHARRMELKIVRKISYVRALYMTFMLFTTRIAIFCTMLSIALLYGSDQITAAKVFAMSSYFGLIANIMSQMFVRGVAEIAEVLVAFKRLQNFLTLEEKEAKYTGSEQNGENETNGFASTDKIEVISWVYTLCIHKLKFLSEFRIFNIQIKTLLLESKYSPPQFVSISIKNASARWATAKTRNPLQGEMKKMHKIGLEEAEVNDLGPPTLTCLNAEFPKGKLIGKYNCI